MIDQTKIKLWDRDLTLPVDYECYKGEEITKEQIDTLNSFLAQDQLIALSKERVLAFCIQNVPNDLTHSDKNNIYSYVHPNKIYVKKIPFVRIAILCDYKYEEDEGLAVIFFKDGKIEVGLQGDIL